MRIRSRAAVATALALVASGSVVAGPGAGAAPAPPPPGPGVTMAWRVQPGAGFDICTAPPTSTMRAWLASPYRTVNIYFAGHQRACQGADQPNLSRDWVRTVVANRWALIPTYVGQQAPCATNTSKTKMSTDPARAEKQGGASADDAIDFSPTGLVALGLPKHTPAYLDLEPFTAGTSATCDRAVRRFVRGWIERLRARGYRAGVYGTPTGAIQVLVDAHRASSAYPVPDAIWFARFNGVASTSYPTIPSTYLPNHRIHQYLGDVNRSYAGFTLNIDLDAMRGDVVAAKTITTPAGAPFRYAISGAPSTGLNVRPTASTQQTSLGKVQNGTAITIECQAVGETVHGDYVWDKIDNADPMTRLAHPFGYVSDLYTNTTGGNGISDSIPHCDTTKPQSVLDPLPAVTLRSAVTFTYSATDPDTDSTTTDDKSGVASYDVRWRRARYDAAGFSAWTSPAAWQRTRAKQQTLAIARGYTTCIEVRSRDRATNVGRWTPQDCVTRPLDDRDLSAATPPWTRGTGSGFYLGTITATKATGARLTRAGVHASQLGIVATRCPTCGVAWVYIGGTRVGRFVLTAASVHRRSVMMLPAFGSARTGKVVLRVSSAGKTVQIDGLVVVH